MSSEEPSVRLHGHLDFCTTTTTNLDSSSENDLLLLMSTKVLFTLCMNSVAIRNQQQSGTDSSNINETLNDLVKDMEEVLVFILFSKLPSNFGSVKIHTNNNPSTTSNKSWKMLIDNPFDREAKCIVDDVSYFTIKDVHEFVVEGINQANTRTSESNLNRTIGFSSLVKDMTLQTINTLMECSGIGKIDNDNKNETKSKSNCSDCGDWVLLVGELLMSPVNEPILSTTSVVFEQRRMILNYLTTVSYIFSTIYLLVDVLNVRSMSCTPLPIHVSVVRKYSHLFVNVPIQMINTFYPTCCQVTFAGILLLKQLLLSLSKSTISAGSIPPLHLIQPISAGVEWDDDDVDDKIDNDNNLNTVSISKSAARNKAKNKTIPINLFLGIVASTNANHNVPHTNPKILQKPDLAEPNQVNCVVRDNCNGDATTVSDTETIVVGSSLISDAHVNTMLLIETNIDDMTPEHLSHATNVLLKIGKVADVWLVPIVMKKGRSAQTLRCLCTIDQRNTILKLLFQNTTTLGIRIQTIDRIALKRTIVSVPAMQQIDSKTIYSVRSCANTSNTTLPSESEEVNQDDYYMIDVKIGYLNGAVISMKAEFDHCEYVSLCTGIPIHDVAADAVNKVRTKIGGQSIV